MNIEEWKELPFKVQVLYVDRTLEEIGIESDCITHEFDPSNSMFRISINGLTDVVFAPREAMAFCMAFRIGRNPV